jgi:hypothetical protein
MGGTGRVTYWDGEDIADVTTHPRFDALRAGGGRTAQHLTMNRSYDLAGAKERALCAAGAKLADRPRAEAVERTSSSSNVDGGLSGPEAHRTE